MASKDGKSQTAVPEENNEQPHKVVLLGDSGVGKTCIMQRFLKNTFEDKVASTIGVDFAIKRLHVNDRNVKLTIWDTAGQERFRTLTSTFYRGAEGVILVYDVSDRESYLHLEESWIPEVKEHCSFRSMAKVVVANKVDKVDERQVTWDEGSELARRHGCLFVETSAKTNVAVALAFEELALQIVLAPELSGANDDSMSLTGSIRGLGSTCCW